MSRIVVEIEVIGDAACALPRRHWLSSQQSFGWRRQLRYSAARPSEAEAAQIAGVIDAFAQAPAIGRRRAFAAKQIRARCRRELRIVPAFAAKTQTSLANVNSSASHN